jgi:outer membrane murein-binding lipoprotein Lpp
MKKILSLFVVVATVSLFSGCASGPKFNETKSSIPPLAQDQGRIFFYRNNALGAGVQPAAKLNGEVIGKAKPMGFFYVDRAPGTYEVETTTEVKRTLSLMLEKGQTRYVRFNISMGFFVGHVYPEIIEDTIAANEIQKCSFIGKQ